MVSIRLRRFHHALDPIVAMQFTPRDAEIIRLVSQHRFLACRERQRSPGFGIFICGTMSIGGGSPRVRAIPNLH